MILALRRLLVILWTLAAVMNGVTLWMVFSYAPVEVTMGAVQKIFYYHVPSAITCNVLLFLACLFSGLYLWKDDPLYDTLAFAMAEVGWVFITLVMVTGPIWGHSAWGKWWVWEPRLTSFLVLWLMYSAYFLLRLFSRTDARTARIAAVVAIIAFFDLPIIYKAIDWWGSIVHPKKVVLEASMKHTFLMALASVLMLAAAMALTRVNVGLAERRQQEEEANQ